MNQRTARSLVRANAIAAAVFALLLGGILYAAQPGPDLAQAVSSREVFSAAQSGQDAGVLRFYLQSCLDKKSLLAAPARERGLLLSMVEALSLIAVILFVANALTIRQAVADVRSNP